MLNYYTVKDIKDACLSMCNDADKYDRIDVREAEKEVKVQVQKLQEEYSKEFYDEEVIGYLKEETEHAALALESILARVNDYYRNRYITRTKVIRRFSDIEEEIVDAYNKGDEEKVGRLCADRFTLKDFAESIGHIKFQLTDDDVQCLKLMGVDDLCITQS